MYSVEHLQRLWDRGLSRRQREQLAWFLSPEQMHAQHPRWEWSVGRDPVSRGLVLLLPVAHCEQLRREMAATLDTDLPADPFSIPYHSVRPVGPLASASAAFEALEAMEPEKTMVEGRIVAVDLEAYELDQSVILEVGYCVFDTDTKAMQSGHYIVDENKQNRNGKYVQDRRHGFGFGQTLTRSRAEIVAAMQEVLESAQVLVGHGLQGDVAYLETLGVHLPPLEQRDTAVIQAARTKGQPVKLSKLARSLGIKDLYVWHNAGNDAHYTMEVFLRQMGIEY